MKITSQIQSVKVSLRQGLQITVPAKLLGGLALGALLMIAVALPSGAAQASPLSELPVGEVVMDIENEGGTIGFFEPWELGQGTNPYLDNGESVRGGVLAAPLYIAEPPVGSDLGGGITDFEEAYTNKVSSLPTQLVDIEDEGSTYPEVEL